METIVDEGVPDETRAQYMDNIAWIRSAADNNLVVGSRARILYTDAAGRMRIAQAFNDAIRDKIITVNLLKLCHSFPQAPIILSRDHHDVSGTDSPYRETSNITDGSAYTADMSVQNCIGDAVRGATWVALHNGGGCGWGEVINGGFGLVLDGSDECAARAQRMLAWDVSNGVARRCWAGNANARTAIGETMRRIPSMRVTVPNAVEDEQALDKLVDRVYHKL